MTREEAIDAINRAVLIALVEAPEIMQALEPLPRSVSITIRNDEAECPVKHERHLVLVPSPKSNDEPRGSQRGG